MRKALIYRATNKEKGKEIEGTAKELAAVIGCTSNAVNKIALEGGSIYGWRVVEVEEIERKQPKTCNKEGIPSTLWQEWEEVTKLFRRKSSVG